MELAKYNIDVAVLCETRFSESGSVNGKPKEKEGRPEMALLSKSISSQS